ncbi:MAG: type II toxin-antitoxin system PemK/MazF family toxin [Solirubrobacteraceae bacterium]
MSVDQLGTGPSDLCIVVPLTTTQRPNPLHIQIAPPEGGVRELSWAMPEMVRSISHRRLIQRWGSVRAATLEAVAGRVRLRTRPTPGRQDVSRRVARYLLMGFHCLRSCVAARRGRPRTSRRSRRRSG